MKASIQWMLNIWCTWTIKLCGMLSISHKEMWHFRKITRTVNFLNLVQLLENICWRNSGASIPQKPWRRLLPLSSPSHFPFPPPSIRSRTPQIQLEGLGECCELPQPADEIEFGASGGNNFNYFRENQLTKFKLCPPRAPNFLRPILPPSPRISVIHFASPRVPLDAPGVTDGRKEKIRDRQLALLSTHTVHTPWKLITTAMTAMIMNIHHVLCASVSSLDSSLSVSCTVNTTAH